MTVAILFKPILKMKKLKLFLLAILAPVLLLTPFLSTSQNYEGIAKMYPISISLIDNIEVTSYQKEKIKKAYDELGEKIKATQEDFLFPADEVSDLLSHQQFYYNEVAKILMPEQMALLEKYVDEKEAKLLESKAIGYMEEYDFLDLSFEQAKAIVLERRRQMRKKLYGIGQFEISFKKLLTEEQFELYEAHKKDVFDGEETGNYEMAIEKQYRDEMEKEIQKLLPVFVSLTKVVEDYYLPEQGFN